MLDYDVSKFKNKVLSRSSRDGEQLIFEWVKTGVIGLGQFRELLRINKSARSTAFGEKI